MYMDVMVLKKDDLDVRNRIKNLIFYCHKCGYVVSLSNYKRLKDIIFDANVVRFYGNEPSVRRAIRLINLDSKIKDHFEVIMSERVRQRVLEEDKLKQETKPKFKVHKGTHTVVFL